MNQKRGVPAKQKALKNTNIKTEPQKKIKETSLFEVMLLNREPGFSLFDTCNILCYL